MRRISGWKLVLLRKSPVKKNEPLPLCLSNSLRMVSPPSAYPCPVKTTANVRADVGPRMIPPSRYSRSGRTEPWPAAFPLTAACPDPRNGTSAPSTAIVPSITAIRPDLHMAPRLPPPRLLGPAKSRANPVCRQDAAGSSLQPGNPCRDPAAHVFRGCQSVHFPLGRRQRFRTCQQPAIPLRAL